MKTTNPTAAMTALRIKKIVDDAMAKSASWRRRFHDERDKTSDLEDQVARLKAQRDGAHRMIEGLKTKAADAAGGESSYEEASEVDVEGGSRKFAELRNEIVGLKAELDDRDAKLDKLAAEYSGLTAMIYDLWHDATPVGDILEDED